MRTLKSSIVLASLMLSGLAVRGDLTIADNGQSQFRIVVPADALLSERYAAEELQSYLERIGRARLPIVTDAEPVGAAEILLGENTHLKELGAKLDLQKLGSDGFTMRTHKGHLIIAGGKPRGTLYGVYELLEQKFGVRWFAPDVEVVPARARLVLPDLDESQVPKLEYREVFWTEMMRDPDFAARHRQNGNSNNLKPKHGGRAVVYHPFVHSFDALIPATNFTAHPEYFPMIKGKRTSGYVQRCLSNPEVVKMAKQRVRQWIREHPEASIISVSQNDTGNWCQCETCKAFDDAEGSPSASLIRFVNAVAEDIEKDFPAVRIDTLAYQYTRKPPKTLNPRPNVIIRLCSIECCFAHPLGTCPSEENRRFSQDIMAWQPVSTLLYIWDYTPNFAHYQQPFPNFDALQPNVKFFVEHGVKGLFEQGNYSGGGHGEMEPLRAYLLAKLLWDPDTDVARHTREFLTGYYGKAASKIQDYLDATHRPVRDKGLHAHIYDPPKAGYLSDDVIQSADRLLSEAEDTADDDAVRFRVQVARLPISYVKLAANKVTGDERTRLLEQFLKVARKAGISDIREGGSLDSWARSMGAK